MGDFFMEGRLNLRNEKIKLNKKDARENKIYIYFIIFFLGCIVGFTYETILGIFHLGGLYSKQGLLIGPFIPVYGTGAVLFTVFLKNMKSKFNIFIASILIGGILEYFYSFFQQIIFGTVSWDYQGELLNIDGRTSIVFAIFWGIIGVLYITYVYPTILKIISHFNEKAFSKIALVVTVFMSINILLTVATSYRQTMRYKGVKAQNVIDIFLDKYFSDEVLNNLYTNRIRKE